MAENDFAFAILDSYPVSPGHTLVIPKRLVVSVFDLRPDELAACWDLLAARRAAIVESLRPRPIAFNIGINDGEIAGQTIAHAHIHLIPRFLGDHPDPRGGVRGVIPGKGPY